MAKLPSGYNQNTTSWEKWKNLKNAMHKVEVATEEHFFLTCAANPYKLICRGCKCFSHCGMCKHVLAVTHVLEHLKAEEERDAMLDLHKLMCTLNRGAGETCAGETVDGVVARRRRRNRGKTDMTHDGQEGTVTKNKGVVKRTGGVGPHSRDDRRMTGVDSRGGSSSATSGAKTTTRRCATGRTTMRGRTGPWTGPLTWEEVYLTSANAAATVTTESTATNVATMVSGRGKGPMSQTISKPRTGVKRQLWKQRQQQVGQRLGQHTQMAKGGGGGGENYQQLLESMIQGFKAGDVSLRQDKGGWQDLEGCPPLEPCSPPQPEAARNQ